MGSVKAREAQYCYNKVWAILSCLDFGLEESNDALIVDCLTDLLLFHLSVKEFVK